MIRLRTWRVVLGVILGIVFGMVSGVVLSGRPSASGSAPGPQDVVSLDRRINQLEQRLISIESSINRLDRQAALPQRTVIPPIGGRDPELGGLRSEVNTFSRRLVEIECGLLKLDTRTSSPAAREALRRTGQSFNDPCRINAASPLRLSARP